MSIYDSVEGWVIDYPDILELSEKAQEVFWMAKEIEVNADINNFLTKASESDKHALRTISQIFVAQELGVSNYWIERIYKKFDRPDIRSMATFFGMTEAAIHARFYAKIPEALRLDEDPNFYKEYHNVEEFEDRMKLVGEALKDDNDLLSIATFAIIEKVTLFTQFALLKSYNNNGFNLFPKVSDGINFSSVDENYHGDGGILLFNHIKNEIGIAEETEQLIKNVAYSLLKHEYSLLDMIYEKGDIGACGKSDLKLFLHHRWNDVMIDLGFKELATLEEGDNPVAKWFYNGIKNKMTSSDNFAALSNTYNKKWQAANFEW